MQEKRKTWKCSWMSLVLLGASHKHFLCVFIRLITYMSLPERNKSINLFSKKETGYDILSGMIHVTPQTNLMKLICHWETQTKCTIQYKQIWTCFPPFDKGILYVYIFIVIVQLEMQQWLYYKLVLQIITQLFFLWGVFTFCPLIWADHGSNLKSPLGSYS